MAIHTVRHGIGEGTLRKQNHPNGQRLRAEEPLGRGFRMPIHPGAKRPGNLLHYPCQANLNE